MEPVKPQVFRRNQDARDALAKERKSLNEANSRLRRSKAWYKRLRESYGK